MCRCVDLIDIFDDYLYWYLLIAHMTYMHMTRKNAHIYLSTRHCIVENYYYNISNIMNSIWNMHLFNITNWYDVWLDKNMVNNDGQRPIQILILENEFSINICYLLFAIRWATHNVFPHSSFIFIFEVNIGVLFLRQKVYKQWHVPHGAQFATRIK